MLFSAGVEEAEHVRRIDACLGGHFEGDALEPVALHLEDRIALLLRDRVEPLTRLDVEASPFAGATNIENNEASGDKTNEMEGPQTSYGCWFVPPDINNQVLCCFTNGGIAKGCWFGCLYQQFMKHMVPAVGINVSTDDEVNRKNLTDCAGAGRYRHGAAEERASDGDHRAPRGGNL